MRLISKLIKDISLVLEKLLKYFNGTAILTLFVLPLLGLLPVIFTLDLNNLESAIFLILHKLPDVFEKLSLYVINYTLASQDPDLLHYQLGCYLFRLYGQWMVHNITPLFLSSSSLTAWLAVLPVFFSFNLQVCMHY